MTLVLLDDVGRIRIGVEGVHEDKGYVDIVGAVEVLDLPYGQVEEGHAVADLDDGLWTNAAHGGAKTAIEFDNGKFVQIFDGLGVWQRVVLDDLVGLWGCNAVPLDHIALGLVVEVPPEEGEEVVHFGLESLPISCQRRPF